MAELLAVTSGVGAEHARLAALAAERMARLAGVAVRILGEGELRRCGLRDPNHLKFRLFDLVEADNVLYFDADAFCLRPWAPAAWADRREWLAVRGFWFDARVERLGRLYGFGADTFNGGLFLCNRRHHAGVLRLAEALQRADGTFHGLANPDEIAFSTALRVLGVPVRFLDRRFNWIQYGHGDLAEGAGVIVAHACHPELRRRYLACGPAAEEDSPAAEISFAPFAGATYFYERVGYDRRPLTFRPDGTIGAGGGDAERYYFVRQGQSGAELVLGAALERTCVLRRGEDGIWQGRWSAHERMAVRLCRHRGQGLLDLLARRGHSYRPLLGVEVGVDRGEASALLLAGLPRMHLYLVDPWSAAASDAVRTQPDCDAALAAAAEGTAFAGPRRTLVPCGHERAAEFLPDGLDLVFLDADHSHAATLGAIATWWPKLRPGGLLAGHDYGHPDYPGVRRAVDEFARRHGLAVRLGEDWLWHYEDQP